MSTNEKGQSHRFQVDLRGVIELLSYHFYSSPKVFVRELLQNAVDAIRFRERLDPAFEPRVRVEVVKGTGEAPPTVVFDDNGIGLTEEEVHAFLATIGQSSKRGVPGERPDDFIGQFGIGLLSCFMVSDEIVIVTKSAKSDEPAVEWKGRCDGTYTIRLIERSLQPGTRVYVQAKPEFADYFEVEKVRELATHFGGLLPYSIEIVQGNQTWSALMAPPPWRSPSGGDREALLSYGSAVFGAEFIDVIPLRSEAGGVRGAAYVLPSRVGPAHRCRHRAYLKGMLVSDREEKLLPDWTFFAQCMIDATRLRPTASREGFVEDEILDATRENLGRCIRSYLVDLATNDPRRLEAILKLHYRSISVLAADDLEFFKIIGDWLPFETSLGEMSLGEIRRKGGTVRYTTTVDRFRQISQVAAAQNICVVNGGYAYNEDLLQQIPHAFPEIDVERVEAQELSDSFEDLTIAEREEVFDFLKVVDLTLRPFTCAGDAKKFRPKELPVLYVTNEDALFRRSVDQSKEVATDLFASVLDSVSDDARRNASHQLCFNFLNPLVKRLARMEDPEFQRRCIETLYVQALLLGHHPLNEREWRLLNEGLMGLMEWGLAQRGGEGEGSGDGQ